VLGLWFVLQLFTGASQQIGGGGVAWGAHVGGFVVGMILVVVTGGRRSLKRSIIPPTPPITPLPPPWGTLGP